MQNLATRLLASRYRRNLELLSRHGSLSQNYSVTALGRRRLGRGGVLNHARFYSAEQPLSNAVDLQRNNTPKSNRLKWTIGTAVALTLPFWSEKWKTLVRIGDEVEVAEKVVENVAEVVEKVAEVAEKVSSEVADRLPKDGMLKDGALFLERVSKEVAGGAHLTEDILHKVDEFKEGVEALLEPIIQAEKDVDKKGDAK